MSISGISLRLITKQDLEFVRQLRNANRRYFFDTKVVTKKSQQEWWSRYLDSHGHLFYIICHNNIPIGTIAESSLGTVQAGNVVHGLFEVGNLMLNRDAQGKGYMTEALRQLTARGGFFVAFVKPRNTASLKVFERGEFWRVTS